MSKTSTLPAYALSRVVAADSSVIEENKVGRLPAGEFEILKGLGYVRKPTAEEVKAAEGEPVAAEPAPGAE